MRSSVRSRVIRYTTRLLILGVVVDVLVIALMFPYWVDPVSDQTARTREFYAKSYAKAVEQKPLSQPPSEKEELYVSSARGVAELLHVPDVIRDFVGQYRLADKKVLEVGAGSGQLQDYVADYTGLDISPTARRFFHKPFVEASATEMPFPDATFDALWSVWVLEHIPNPELALNEMRRVTKPGGLMLVFPALDVSRFTAQGLHARPYKDLDWKSKLLKSIIPIAESKVFHLLYFHQVRILRSLGVRLGGGPSSFHFIRLEPNYEQYWEGDSDATASFSNHELYLWFKTRGDTCLNCPSEARLTLRDHPTPYLVIQKQDSTTSQ